MGQDVEIGIRGLPLPLTGGGDDGDGFDGDGGAGNDDGDDGGTF